MIHDSNPDGGRQNYFGLYPAIVTDLMDLENLGRIEVRFPFLGIQGDSEVRAWATLLSPYADRNQGLQILPEVDSQVIVGFEAGNLRRPYIVGSCWNGTETLPDIPLPPNNIRMLKTRSGHTLKFDDTEDATKLSLTTADGHFIEMDDGLNEVTLSHSNGSTIVMRASGTIEINANAGVDINAPVLNVHAPAANFDGIVNCASLIANTVVSSPVYTPGAGNIW